MRRVSPGAVASLAVATGWVALAAWRPDTTWHAGPLLVAGAWPWMLAMLDETEGDETDGAAVTPARVVRAGVAGLVTAVVVTVALEALDLLRGPTLWGPGNAVVEALLFAVAGAALVVAAGAVRHRPQSTPSHQSR